ncbi:MAG: N-acetylmuramoyl-L-alanine amidase [Gammaproteobacteria bacterium]|jgi:N-acetylmuramoyl-L-alanine amidase
MKKQQSLLLLLLLIFPVLVQATRIEGVRMWSGPDGTRVVFDINRRVEPNVFVLKDPDRVVIDLENTAFAEPVTALDYNESLVSGIRSATHNQHDLRIVLDMKSAVMPNSFILNPTSRYGHRLVVDLEPLHPASASPIQQAPERTTTPAAVPPRGRKVVVALDAGHGGEDPGAIGRRGSREKDIVLAIARKLYALLQNQDGITPVMIRDGDYYVSLRGRIRKARRQKADLFVSIHADAFRNGRAKGSSVYVLSQKGASSEAARWLAASENNADLIGGVSLDDKDDVLASVLLDLSQNATLADSINVGQKVLGELKRVGSVHKSHVEHAGFVVLKSPDVPSILVETGFISNWREEKLLRSRRHQQRIAQALFKGIRHYLITNPPAGSQLAMQRKRRHQVVTGDTLSSIARQYRISTHRLKAVNGLSGDTIKVGHTLIIPQVGGS